MWTALRRRLSAALGGPEGKGLAWYSGRQFALFRGALGIYLVHHFGSLLPWSAQLYSREGVFHDTDAAFWILFPGLLQWLDAPWMVTVFLSLATGSSLLFTLGLWRPVVSLLLWYALASLAARNFFTFNLHWNYAGWLLLACALVPSREPWSLDRWRRGPPVDTWTLPATLYWGLWAILGLSYTVSGLSKLGMAEWRLGLAVSETARSAIGLPNAASAALLSLPELAQRVVSWAVLAAELLAAPLSLHRRTRPFAWAGMVAVHLGILLTARLTELSLGMLLVHLLVFDARWLKR